MTATDTMRASAPILVATMTAVLLTSTCSRQSAVPTSPSVTNQVCRTYATSSRSVQTVELGTDRADLWQLASTCRWAADRLTCTQQYSQFRGDCSGEPGNGVWTATYGSAADFVDEAMTTPPVSKALTLSVTSSSGRCPSPFDARLQYDGAGRVVHITSTSAENFAANSNRTLTAWDTRGRPTDGTFANFRVNGPVVYRYDEGARTTTEIGTFDGGQWIVTTTTSYDASGIVVREVLSDAIPGEARPTYTTTTTVLATDRVCK